MGHHECYPMGLILAPRISAWPIMSTVSTALHEPEAFPRFLNDSLRLLGYCKHSVLSDASCPDAHPDRSSLAALWPPLRLQSFVGGLKAMKTIHLEYGTYMNHVYKRHVTCFPI